MANEARLNVGLQIKVGNLDYTSRPTAFTADVSAASAPTPGEVVATVAGVDVSLAARTVPGLARIQNLDATNYVSIGLYDPDTAEFYPMLEALPGESYVFRIARNIGSEQTTGTGTTGSGVTLRIKSSASTCKVMVEVFEK